MQKLSAEQILRRAFLKIVRKATVFAMVLFSQITWFGIRL